MAYDRFHGWTRERCDLLHDLLAEGLSAAEIGRRMGKSPNAIIGKAQRLFGSFGAVRGRPRQPPKAEPIPEPPKATPIRIEPVPGKDPRLCIAPGCGLTRMAQNLHRLCQRHDQERINAKRKAA